MSSPTIAIIMPTLGRATLQAAIDSAVYQMGAGDEFIVVDDSTDRIDFSQQSPAITCMRHFDPKSTYGNAQRNAAMREATADLFVFLDDDDELMPGALSAIRSAAAHELTPMMFRMEQRWKQTTLWKERVVRPGNVGGAMFIVPNDNKRLYEWPENVDDNTSDFSFITGTLAMWPPGSLRWFEHVIYLNKGRGLGKFDTVRRGQRVYIHPTANVYQSYIGDDTKVGALTEIGGSSIGHRCKIQAHVFIPPGVTLGNEVFVGPGAVFTNDRNPSAMGDWQHESTHVGHGASIGANATILAGVSIGAAAVVGAGVTVIRDVAPGETYTGDK